MDSCFVISVVRCFGIEKHGWGNVGGGWINGLDIRACFWVVMGKVVKQMLLKAMQSVLTEVGSKKL